MTVKLPIYLDSNATTAVDPRVLEAMLPYFSNVFGNAASRSHAFGWAADKAVEKARGQIAALLNASDPKEIVITSGATEANNLAIKGVAEMYGEEKKHIVTSIIEHKAVIDPCKYLETKGFTVTWLKPGKDGRITTEQVAEAIRPDTVLVSLMAANNEIGTVNPVAAIGKVCHERGVFYHCDATQAVGKIPLDVQADGIDLLSASAHKLYGPKGVGCLYVRKRNPRVRLSLQMHGGGHEQGKRSGTLNVPGIVGFGAACELAGAEMKTEIPRIAGLRDRLEEGIMGRISHVVRNGCAEFRLPQTTNLSFEFVEGESLLMGIDDIAVSSGSACTSASLEPSYVLKALGVSDEMAHSSIRFGLGRFTTAEEVDYTVEKLVGVVKRLREMSPLYELAMEGVDWKTVKWGGVSGN